MKKKLVSTLMGLVLVLSMTTAAFATTVTVEPDTDGNPSPTSGTTSVTFNVDPSYTVTIPAAVELFAQGTDPETYANELKVTAAAGVRLDEGKQITVTLSGDSWDTDSFYLTADTATNYKLAYTVKVGDSTTAITNNGVVAEFTTSDAEQSSTLKFAAGDPEYAGEYSDTVTFTLAVVDSSN